MKSFALLPSILLLLVCCSFPATAFCQAEPQQPLEALPAVEAPLTTQSGDQPSQTLQSAAAPASAPESVSPETSTITVKAYYFHGERRCKTCLAIEANTRETIEKGYPEELAQGQLSWLSVDIDQKDNKHFEKEFDLMFSSVILVKFRDGKQVEWKNLQKVWELVWDKPAFEDYIRNEIKSYLES